MTPQIRSRTEYLIPTYVLVLLLHSNFIYKSIFIGGFPLKFDDNSKVTYFLVSHPVCCRRDYEIKRTLLSTSLTNINARHIKKNSAVQRTQCNFNTMTDRISEHPAL